MCTVCPVCLFLRLSLSQSWSSLNRPGGLGKWDSPKDLPICASPKWDYKCGPPPPAYFTWVLGITLRFSGLHNYFTDWTISLTQILNLRSTCLYFSSARITSVGHHPWCGDFRSVCVGGGGSVLCPSKLRWSVYLPGEFGSMAQQQSPCLESSTEGQYM
jgi:hypothetical protein